jgi:hypothetical protein
MTLGLVAGLLSFAPAAQASHETVDSVSLFQPQDEGDFNDKNVLSDRFDGQDSLAHLTAIADPDATSGSFYVCDNGYATADFDTDCQLIGTDSTPVVPEGGDPTDPDADEAAAAAFEFYWDIPAAFDSDGPGGFYFNITFVACVGGAPDQDDIDQTDTAPGTDNRCDYDYENNVALDDSSTEDTGPFGDQDATSGEIALFCSGGEGGAAATECDELDEGSAIEHGTNVPATDFAIGFTTSDDVSPAGACLDNLGGSGLEEGDDAAGGPFGDTYPEGCDVYSVVTVRADEDNAADPDPGTAWIAYFADGSLVQGSDYDLAIFGEPGPDDNNFGECGDDFADPVNTNPFGPDIVNEDGVGIDEWNGTECLLVFDEHYIVTNAESTAQGGVTASFDIPDAIGAGDEGEDDGCNGDADEVVNDEETNLITGDPGAETSTSDEIEGCAFDASGELQDQAAFVGDEEAVFELEGAGTLVDTDDCDAQDLDDDVNNQNEVAVCTTADAEVAADPGDGEANEFDIVISPLEDADGNVVRGDGIVTFCIDAEGADATEAEFGCGDETETASVTKSYTGAPFSVDLVFQNESAPESDPCAGGDKFRTNEEGDTDTLVACVYDESGQLVSTSETGGDLDWDNSNPGAVAFAGNPPNDSGASGTATLAIQAVNEGSSTIEVGLDADDDGADDSTSTVTKTVTPGSGGQPECNDGVDNDSDGATDYPNDAGCSDINDNTENSDQPGETITHARNATLGGFKHIKLPGKKKPALRVKGTVNAPDYADCEAFVPVKVQLRASGEWITRKTDVTNENGVWKVLIRDVKGRYRVTATRFEIVDNANNIHVCQRARDEARHRH